MNPSFVLVVNPGSASRKYALFADSVERAQLHFEWSNDTILCTLTTTSQQHVKVDVTSLENATAEVIPILRSYNILSENEHIKYIGLRIVAPGSYFLSDHRVDDELMKHLQQAKEHAPLHVKASLTELSYLQQYFPDSPIFAISDSAFHHTKPDHTWNYGISLELADKHDIKRFGYHGLSVESVVRQISPVEKSIVCHLGSGASVTALLNGQSVDTTMGFSPLEGVIMSTRSGSIDLAAANILKKILQYDDLSLEKYLNEESGLKGLGGSADIRELLLHEGEGDARAHLALETYVYTIQKSIGQMAAALNGVDALIFTGTVGERSSPIRKQIVRQLNYLGFMIDNTRNDTTDSHGILTIHDPSSKPIYVIPAHEEQEIAKRVLIVASA